MGRPALLKKMCAAGCSKSRRHIVEPSTGFPESNEIVDGEGRSDAVDFNWYSVRTNRAVACTLSQCFLDVVNKVGR